jgi:viroplasmin and RNaseH domain-containing protein
MTWYVVHHERQTRLFSTWEVCHAHVNGFKGACYRGYETKEEAMTSLSLDDKKMEIKTTHGHPMPLKDVIILVQNVIVLILICIIFCKPN